MRDAETTDQEANGRRSLTSRLVSDALSLQCKATVLVVGLTLSVTAGVSGYLLQAGADLVRDEQRQKLVELSAMLAETSAKAMADTDKVSLEQLAHKVTASGPLAYVVFTTVEGDVLASAQRRDGILPPQRLDGSSAETPIPGTPVYRVSGEARLPYLETTYPINLRTSDIRTASDHDARLVGYLRAGMPANGWHRSMSSTLDMVVGVGIIAVVVAIPLGFLVVRRIVSPLDALAGTMLRFSKGELNVRSPVRRKDEIGRLAAAFNRMADQHQHTHERIVRLNADLENRVAQRTRQLRELAAREPLTALFNRRRFNEVLERSFAEARRYESDLSCIMMDLDDFKNVNDKFGHQAGDELLVFTARLITSQLRATDVPARFGGDEFIVLLPRTGAKRAEVLGRRITEKFAAEVRERFPRLQVGISVGIASLRALNAKDTESLVRAADRAMYEAKAAGTNLVFTATDSLTPAPI